MRPTIKVSFFIIMITRSDVQRVVDAFILDDPTPQQCDYRRPVGQWQDQIGGTMVTGSETISKSNPRRSSMRTIDGNPGSNGCKNRMVFSFIVGYQTPVN